MSVKHPNSYIDHVWRNQRPLGYCHCRIHKGYLNKNLMKKHACLSKGCVFLEKYKEHPYWEKRDGKRKDKKNKKQLQKKYLENLQERSAV